MLKIAAILVLVPCLSFAQKKEKIDTLSVELKETELSILDQYVKEYSNLQQQQQAIQKELRHVEANYQNVVRMKIESMEGDSKKWFIIKDKKLYYLKP